VILRNTVKAVLAVTLMVTFALTASKLYEAYLEHFFIVQTVRLIVTEPGINTRAALQLKQDVVARLRLQRINSMTTEQIQVLRRSSVTRLQVQYNYPVELFGTQVFTLQFDETFP
jgi:hypothetical protein